MRRHGTIYETQNLFRRKIFFLQTNESGSYDCTQENSSTIRGTGTKHEERPARYKYDVRRNKYVEERNYGTQSLNLFPARNRDLNGIGSQKYSGLHSEIRISN